MPAVLSAKFKLIDEMSSAMTSLGNTGNTVLAGLEDSCAKVDAAMQKNARSTSQASSALSAFSGSASTAASQSRILSDIMVNETAKLESSAQKARIKADSDAKAAEAARSFYNEMKNQVISSENVSEAMEEEAKQALELAERLEKTAKKSEQKARSAQDAARAMASNSEAAAKAALSEDKMSEAASRLAESEKKAAQTVSETEHKTNEYSKAAQEAAADSDKFGASGTEAISAVGSVIASVGIAAALKEVGQEFLNCSHAAAEFETSTAKIFTIADTSKISMGEIRSELSALSADTGQLVTELSDAAYQAISASVDTANSVKFVGEANMLAVGGFTDQTAAADVLTTAINAYSLEVSKAADISDMLITTQNLGKTTVDELAQNIGRVIPLAAAYNVEMDNLSSAYAQMTKNGIATAESTTYIKSMLNELGSASSKVSKVLSEETGQSFSQLMEAGYSLGDVLDVIGKSVDGNATAFGNLWSSQEAGIGALSLFNSGASAFNRTLGEMRSSAGAAQRAYNTMTSTTEFASKRMSNSFTNLQIAVGDQLNPVMGKLYNGIADINDEITIFVGEHPRVVTALAGSATALGVAAGAVTVYTAATKAADIITKTFNVTLSAGKIGIIISGIAAAGAVIGTFASAVSSGTDAVEEYNGTMEECKNEIDSTSEKYHAVVSAYGENSEAAKRLSDDLDTLNAQYQKGGGFIADYEQRLKKSRETLDSFMSEYTAKMDEINDNWQNGMVAASQLEALSQKTELTNTDLDMMSKYADYLNDTFNCNIEVNYDTGKLTGFDPTNLNNEMQNWAQESVQNYAQNIISSGDISTGYINAVKNLEEFTNKSKQQIRKDLNALGGKATSEQVDQMFEMDEDYTIPYQKMVNEIASYKAQLYDLFDLAGLEGADEFINSLEGMKKGFDAVTSSAEETVDVLSSDAAVSDIWSQKQSEIEEFAKAYEEAYGSVRESLDGMFGLFEKASMDLSETLSFDDAIANLESQLEYFQQYEDALQSLSDMGLDEDILSGLDPEQVVAFSQKLSEMDPSEAMAKIDELNNKFGELSKVKDETAQTMLEVEKEFSEKLDDMQKDMENAVDNMDLEGEAAAAAKSTMDGYISSLKAHGSTAVTEAENIALKISRALNRVSAPTASASGGVQKSSLTGYAVGTLSAAPGYALVGERGPELIRFGGGERVYTNEETVNILMNSSAIPKLWDNAYASGTTSAQPGAALVGENGPELVLLNGGERIYTASETERIINNFSNPVSDIEKPLYVPPVRSSRPEDERSSPEPPQRSINININGSGSIKAEGNVNKDEIVKVMLEYAKPVFMDIISSEIFEEGDASYEY